jgi:hypothetical protein
MAQQEMALCHQWAKLILLTFVRACCTAIRFVRADTAVVDVHQMLACQRQCPWCISHCIAQTTPVAALSFVTLLHDYSPVGFTLRKDQPPPVGAQHGAACVATSQYIVANIIRHPDVVPGAKQMPSGHFTA